MSYYISSWIIALILAVLILAAKNRIKKKFCSYIHHGRWVWVRKGLKGKHRSHCLCSDCISFHPGSVDNCPIAQAVYFNCVEFNVVTPMWECPNFLRDGCDAEQPWNKEGAL